jgi:hypothetical protein
MSNVNYAAELAARSVGCRLSFRWIGNSKAVENADNSAAAELFRANPQAIRLSKKLFDPSRREFKAVQAIKGKIRRFWVENTLPYTDRGVRLLKRNEASRFAAAIDDLAAELAAAVAELESVFFELLAESRDRLGSLFCRADYPASLIGEFAAAVEFPELSPPDYLSELAPDVYRRESERIAARFDQAIELAETAFSEELSALVDRLVDRLEPDANGNYKTFRDSTIENFSEFIGRFRRLSIGSSEQLDRLVEQAAGLVSNVRPADIRQPGESRERLAAGMRAIGDQLAAGVVNRPARVIRFNPAAELQAANQASEPATVQPDPAAANQESEPAAVQSEPAAVQPDPAAANQESEPAAVQSEPAAAPDIEPERIEFVLNFGGGRLQRLTIPSRPAAVAAAG